MTRTFYITSFIVFAIIGTLSYFHHGALWSLVIVLPLFLIGVYDLVQKKHTILRNFPILGHFRYMFEFISPEIQQYFIERNIDGKPFSRNHRALVYTRAKNINDTRPFGTQRDLESADYEGLRHSIYATHSVVIPPRITIGGKDCKQPYEASLLNSSAMSFGSLSSRAIMAINHAAKRGNFYQNTGEGGLTPYHLEGGGDLVWQIGTGYFGCRTLEGKFDAETFKKKAATPNVKMIELKLSQGAKPGHGGVLPAVKNTKEIAGIRGLKPHTTVISPPGHSEFSDATGLLHFVKKLRDLSGGKPVGFKLCIGKTEEFLDICQAMNNTGILPDFITIDGAEGGTGAAPLEFTDSVGVPLKPALIFVTKTLEKYKLKEHIKIIASGKALTGTSIIKFLALGADLCNSARAFMFAIGCIQALRCNTNECPTGVATQDKTLVKGLVVKDKADRAYYFHKNTLYAAMSMLAACGKTGVEDADISMFLRGDELVALENAYFPDSVLTHNHAD